MKKQTLRYPITVFVVVFLLLIGTYNVIYYDHLNLTDKAYAIMLVLIVISFYLWLMFFVVSPLEEIKKALSKILNGNHKIELEISGNKSIVEFSEQINSLNAQILDAAFNIHDIKAGKIVSNLEDRQDILSDALLSMQKQFEYIKDKEYEQNWVMNGLAKFVEILKNDDQEVEKLYAKILSNLMDYVKAAQGGLFLVQEEDEPYLKLATSYAYEQEIDKNNRIYEGEGLLGQVFKDREMLYLTEIPDNYFKISSGLGSVKAGALLILPLLLNQKIYGILEISSFKIFKDYELEFLQKLTQSLAATIANSQSVEKIKKLLEESLEKSEKLSSQEEEMRQNMEELISTQEEMQRKQIELEDNNKKMQSSEAVLKKALLKAKEKEAEAKRLAEESRMRGEELRSQEEEIRQNLEELISTQEEMQRKQTELENMNQRMMASEAVLKKAILKSKEKELEVKEKTAKIVENESILSNKVQELNELKEQMTQEKEELLFNNKKLEHQLAKKVQQIREMELKMSELENKKN